jgi:hypothetical protein
MSEVAGRPRWALVAAIIAVVFGVLTVISGGSALFGSSTARAGVGDAVPFVLWFNFLSGFVYVLAGAGLFLWTRWGAQLSALLAVAILVVFAAFGWHVASGGAFEIRTVAAMILRSGMWVAIAIAACRTFNCFETGMKVPDVPVNGRTR